MDMNITVEYNDKTARYEVDCGIQGRYNVAGTLLKAA